MLRYKTIRRAAVIVLAFVLCASPWATSAVFADDQFSDDKQNRLVEVEVEAEVEAGAETEEEVDEEAPPVIVMTDDVRKTRTEINADTLEHMKGLGIPMWKIGGKEIPLRSGGMGNVWALLNLLLSILGVVGAVYVIVHRFFVRADQETVYDYDESTADEYGFAEISLVLESQESKTKGLTCTILTAVVAALSVIIFLVVEDTQSLMVLTDRFTIPTLILLILEIVFAFFAERKLRGESEAESEDFSEIRI
jgi:hypothetical protein